MLRVVVAVVVAGGLLAVSLPVVDEARRDHSHAAAAATVDRISAAAERLVRDSDPTVPGRPGATRTLTVTVPAEGWGHAGVSRLRLETTARGSRFRWTVDGQTRSRTLAVPIRAASGPLTLGPGSHRLRLRLVRGAFGRVVTVARV